VLPTTGRCMTVDPIMELCVCVCVCERERERERERESGNYFQLVLVFC